ncbi:AdoMet dependent proline di-methyltransferase-domain-containing protein [Xylaria cubensis]|nr:AdoMet dependent proline di-methyltransferase-domain-containing protein [Xylaria cubensis]
MFTETLQNMSGIRKILNIGLEEWQPAPDVKYDLIWNQWYLGHLTDKQLVRYLKNCSAALEPRDGIITALFREARFDMMRTQIQSGFPDHLFPLKIYASVTRARVLGLGRVFNIAIIFLGVKEA